MVDKDLFRDKTVLVTGAAGSIGSEITHQLLKDFSPKELRLLDNRETELFYLGRKYSDFNNVRILFGDVREKERMMKICNNVDIIFHTAAMKHVIVSEINPFEAVKTNVIGTQNLIDAAIENQVEKMILISTDKAVNPTNVMGSTKLLAERLITSAHYNTNTSNTKFGVVRFGNVLASRGSVLEIWSKQLKNGNKITVTDPNMTRFFMSIPESVNLIFLATKYSSRGEIFILKMPSIRIGDLAESFLELSGYPNNYYEIIGKAQGEKLHEYLLAGNENEMIMESDKLYVVLPPLLGNTNGNDTIIKKLKRYGFRISMSKIISSNDKNLLLNKEQIKKVLKNYIGSSSNYL